MLDASRERPLRAASAPQARFADIRPPEAHRPPAAETNAGTTVTATTSPRQSSEGRAASQPDTTVQDIAQALVSLRQDLKKDIADGVAREMNTLRAEIRGIRSMAEDQQFSEDLRGDLARLAESISQLNGKATPEAEGLRAEFEELRTVMDGLAREESVQRMESHWQGFEARLADLDAAAVREELVALAYRIDEIKSQLGAMSDNPMIRTLEQKLIVLAGAMEQLGSRMHPADADLSGQFATLDERLDEISRAIAVNGRASAAALDQNSLQRLEGRIGALADQIETIGRATLDADMAGGLSARIEALAVWVEELASDQSALRLEERLEQLSQVLDQTQKASAQPELASHLADISRKIDGLAQGTINDALAERLDYLAQRIDGLELPRENPQPGHDHPAFGRIEDRLSDIAARLDEAAEAPKGDSEALRGLEAQIAHLSSLFHERQDLAAPLPGEFESRVTTLENYMATSDEYILEAARQAAEAVVDAYSRNAAAGASLAAADITALGGLAEDLRHLQELTRGSEERTHHTFDALHRTLVQIADRLDTMEDRLAAPRARQELPFADAPQREPAQSSPAVLAASRAGLMSSASVSMEREIQAAAPAEDMQAGLQPEGQALEPTADTALAEDADRQAKPSLLTGLSRLLPGNKGEPSKPARTIVDPTPSIDPVDMLPPERENDLLEPGSGAPDVKKILERVRASQAAGEFGGERPISADRADYIAAARRAAKAAAQETDPSQSEPMARLIGKSARQPKEAGLGGAFSRHKRPILMAVGAVLLALMAMPLVKTLTSGEQAPPAIEAPAEPAGNALPEPTDSTVPSMDGTAPDDTDATGEAAPAAEPTDDTASHLTDPQAAEGTPATIDASGAADTQAAGFVAPETTPVVAEAPPAAEAATEAPAPIVVPAGTEPKSLADAAAAGDPGALFEIGVRYTEGRGVGADLSEAANWYKLAADRGYAPAQYRLANLFEKGTGVDRDLGRAMTYYRQAAEAGNASAMHNLAVLYASGPESQPDYATAVEWFRKAADLGVADSQFNLAILYARGNGISQDLEESYKWFAIAAQSGDKDAAAKRDEVAKAMRQEQLESARAKADAWKAQPLDEKANSVNVPAEWAGAKPLTTASVDMEKAIRNIQAILNKSGFDAGAPDGKLGQKTTAAIKAFQTSVGQEPTGRINDALVKELLARNS
jgi:localization factor PodJL